MQVSAQGDDWFIASDVRVRAYYLGSAISDPSYTRFLDAMSEEIDRRSERVGVLVTIPHAGSFAPLRRQRLGQLMKAKSTQLRATTAHYVFCTPHLVARGMMTALNWIAPPPYANSVCGSEDSGFRTLALHIPELDGERLSAAFARLVQHHRPATLSAQGAGRG